MVRDRSGKSVSPPLINISIQKDHPKKRKPGERMIQEKNSK
jgi:hypothetical protein